jgi:hypothetical protein
VTRLISPKVVRPVGRSINRIQTARCQTIPPASASPVLAPETLASSLASAAAPSCAGPQYQFHLWPSVFRPGPNGSPWYPRATAQASTLPARSETSAPSATQPNNRQSPRTASDHHPPQIARHLLTRNCRTHFSGVLTPHPDQCLQGFRGFTVCLNQHESARKMANSIRLQYPICLSHSRTPPPQIQLANLQELFPVRVPVLVMGLASNQGQVPCPTRERSPHECLVVSDLQPAPRPTPRSRNWFQIRHHQVNLARRASTISGRCPNLDFRGILAIFDRPVWG